MEPASPAALPKPRPGGAAKAQRPTGHLRLAHDLAVPGGIVMSPTRSGPRSRHGSRPLQTQAALLAERALGCRMFRIDKGRAMAGRQVPWQRVPSAVDEAVVVAPAGLNVRLGAGVRHRSEGRRRAGAPTPLQAGRLPPPCRPLGPKGSSLPRRMPREALRGSRSRPRLRKTVPAIGHESRSGDERRRFVRQKHDTSRDLVRCGTADVLGGSSQSSSSPRTPHDNTAGILLLD